MNKYNIINNTISGFYVVKGFYIDYEGGLGVEYPSVKQRLILTRTEHPKYVEEFDQIVKS